ncbi:PREDICTED: uncharacterized protein LOC106148514 [Chinchilla lanigera]|uniref:uncharacterized protein LOC106148514 n=1 Tax=Chinchilla lanigera TaxID=34839 RepID=UPI000697637C|nr:PREDICTED: uncharacterized protein LOC106148514 [Chinchilla lanigera]
MCWKQTLSSAQMGGLIQSPVLRRRSLASSGRLVTLPRVVPDSRAASARGQALCSLRAGCSRGQGQRLQLWGLSAGGTGRAWGSGGQGCRRKHGLGRVTLEVPGSPHRRPGEPRAPAPNAKEQESSHWAGAVPGPSHCPCALLIVAPEAKAGIPLLTGGKPLSPEQTGRHGIGKGRAPLHGCPKRGSHVPLVPPALLEGAVTARPLPGPGARRRLQRGPQGGAGCSGWTVRAEGGGTPAPGGLCGVVTVLSPDVAQTPEYVSGPEEAVISCLAERQDLRHPLVPEHCLSVHVQRGAVPLCSGHSLVSVHLLLAPRTGPPAPSLRTAFRRCAPRLVSPSWISGRGRVCLRRGSRAERCILCCPCDTQVNSEPPSPPPKEHRQPWQQPRHVTSRHQEAMTPFPVCSLHSHQTTFRRDVPLWQPLATLVSSTHQLFPGSACTSQAPHSPGDCGALSGLASVPDCSVSESPGPRSWPARVDDDENACFQSHLSCTSPPSGMISALSLT